ncbi:MAG: UDP-3-O-(3-hydroxymyristoyl)glucosamine N-acyltransferase [Elusimicrobiota bacterium]|jgi:UDP-3-O-[3-hydroxymyristoyl] glucosamine N-acyltransferase|nr:UDP-3-O-(3-hydroxymyristoyl)glucosamine N-acyltransferase [Elusimicrobiota bacterium]
MNLTLEQIARITGARLKGDGKTVITALCGLDSPKEGALSYAAKIDKPEALANLNAAALIVPVAAENMDLPFKGNLLYAENPDWAFTLLLRAADTLNKDIKPGVDARAAVSPGAKLGKNVFIGANAVVEDGAVIGDNTIIYPNVYIGRNVQIGQNCVLYPGAAVREECILKNKVILQPGAVIGSDGFGYIFHNGRHEKIPQIGNVILEDDVEIGANATIDRAKINSTIIGANTKIDNLVQIGHNVKTGAACVIVSQAGIAGSTELGNGVIVAGQAGINGHIKIGDGAAIGPQAGVMSDVQAHAKLMGSPALEAGAFMRSYAIFKKMPELYKELMAIKKKFKFFG